MVSFTKGECVFDEASFYLSIPEWYLSDTLRRGSVVRVAYPTSSAPGASGASSDATDMDSCLCVVRESLDGLVRVGTRVSVVGCTLPLVGCADRDRVGEVSVSVVRVQETHGST
ncbi:hypothetical protein KIPB_012623, partial [Kipferlia bialata]|eukprot:g12623.t1